MTTWQGTIGFVLEDAPGPKAGHQLRVQVSRGLLLHAPTLPCGPLLLSELRYAVPHDAELAVVDPTRGLRIRAFPAELDLRSETDDPAWLTLTLARPGDLPGTERLHETGPLLIVAVTPRIPPSSSRGVWALLHAHPAGFSLIELACGPGEGLRGRGTTGQPTARMFLRVPDGCLTEISSAGAPPAPLSTDRATRLPDGPLTLRFLSRSWSALEAVLDLERAELDTDTDGALQPTWLHAPPTPGSDGPNEVLTGELVAAVRQSQEELTASVQARTDAVSEQLSALLTGQAELRSDLSETTGGMSAQTEQVSAINERLERVAGEMQEFLASADQLPRVVTTLERQLEHAQSALASTEASLQGRLAVEQAQAREWRRMVTSAEAKAERWRREAEESSAPLPAGDHRATELEVQLEEVEESLSDALERAHSAEQQVAQLQEELSQVAKREQSLEARLAEAPDPLDDMGVVPEMAQRLAVAEARAHASESALEEAQEETDAHAASAGTLRNELAAAALALKEKLQRIRELEAEIQEAQLWGTSLEQDLAEAEDREAQLAKQLKTLRRTFVDLEERVMEEQERAQAELAEMRAENAQLRLKRSGRTTRGSKTRVIRRTRTTRTPKKS